MPGTPQEPGSPDSTLLYGSCRPLVNLLLFATAEAANPSFHWLEIRAPLDSGPELEPVGLGWIDEQRLWTADPSEALAPDNARANAALFELVRDDEPPETLARLSEFLRLPPRVQQILARMPPSQPPGVIAVANADRAKLPSPDANVPPILNAVAWAGYSLFVGYCGPPPSVRTRFATVLRVDGDSVYRWADARLTLEGGTGRGGLRPNTPVRLADLPFAARVLRRATEGT